MLWPKSCFKNTKAQIWELCKDLLRKLESWMMTPNITNFLQFFKKSSPIQIDINLVNSAIHAIFAYYSKKSALMKPYMSSSSGWNLKIFKKKISWNLFFHFFFTAPLIKVLDQTSRNTMKRLDGRVQILKIPPLLFIQIFFKLFKSFSNLSEKPQRSSM